MVKFVVLYNKPQDTADFDAHYRDVHVPLVNKIPNLDHWDYGKVLGTPDGGEPPFYFMAELYFSDADTMGASMASPEGEAAGADVPTFASGGATVMVAEA